MKGETKGSLKPICNNDRGIMARLRSFGTRLRAVDLTHLMG